MGSKSSNNRLAYIDFLKAFAIFLVVLGHVKGNYGANISVIDVGIVPYHMPLFAILSGLFFSASPNVYTFFCKKFQQIALPLITWCFIQVVIIYGFNELYNIIIAKQPIHIVGLFKWWLYNYLDYLVNYGWWFLRALFFSFIYAYISIRLCKRNILYGVISSILVLHVLSLTGIIPNRWMSHSVFLYPFFCVGILMKEYKSVIISHEKVILYICLFFSIVGFSLWHGYDSFFEMNTSMLEPEGQAGITGWLVLVKTIYRFVTGVSISIALILLVRRIDNYIPHHSMNVGRNTLGIYILHGFTFSIFLPPDSHILFDNVMMSFFACVLISLSIVVVSSYVVKATGRIHILNLLLWGRTQ